MSEIAYHLSDTQHDIDQIDKKYPKLLKYMCQNCGEVEDDSIAQFWRDKIVQVYKTLDEELVTLQNYRSVALQAAVSRAHALSKIDWFVAKVSFGNLYITYQKTLRDDAGYTKVSKGLSEMNVTKINFAEIGHEMNRMVLIMNDPKASNKTVVNNLYQQCQKLLIAKIEDLFLECKSMVVRLAVFSQFFLVF